MEQKLFVHKCVAIVDGEECGNEFVSNVRHSVCPSCGVEDAIEYDGHYIVTLDETDKEER